MNFHYRMNSIAAPATRVDRSYMKPSLRIGGQLTWNVTDRLSARGGAFGSLPIPNTPMILSGELEMRYQLWRSGPTRVMVLVGVTWELIEYQDRQTLPNHIRMEMGPLATVGLGVSF